MCEVKRTFWQRLMAPTWRDYYIAYHVFRDYNRADARKLRGEFFPDMSIAAFYAMMAKLEERQVVKGWNDRKNIGYETRRGRTYVLIRVRYYKSLIRKSPRWRML